VSKLYDFSEYDKYLCLKPSAELWFVILYLLRPFIVLLATRMLSRVAPGVKDVENLRYLLYPDDFSLVVALLATAPVLIFIYGFSKRKPGAGVLVRRLWKNGANLLAAAAVLNVPIVFAPLLTGTLTRIHLMGWVQAGLAIVIIGYLYSSHRVRDTFADFPVENDR
jgi:Protein of unknown function (DUF2919)